MRFNRVARVVLVAALTSPVLIVSQGASQAATQTPARSPTQGLKETDKFVKAGEATTKALTDAKTEVQKTLDTYNALVTQPSTNMKGDYKKLMKSMDSMNDKVAAARTKVEAMQKTGDTYFSGRAETIKNIQDPALLGQAQQRLKANQEHFGAVLMSLREAGASLEPFRKQLADHITYLGSDLTPSAMTSLKPQAEKLNAQGGELFKNIDEASAKANSYLQSIRSET